MQEFARTVSDGEDLDCPLCMEEIDLTDRYFNPCPCGYQICRFCWNHIKENLNGLCPACRRPYSEETVEFRPVSPEELARIKLAKKKKERERKEQEMVARKQLANVRVIQKNLVYVLGLPPKICSEEILRQNDYFGQYGKILKIVINRRPTTNAQGLTVINGGVYITYVKKEDALKAIEAVDGSLMDGRPIKATFGTTKYCSYYLRNQPCQNTLCQYLHEPGEEAEQFLKEEKMYRQSFKAQVLPSLSKKDDKEESALPASASWAKSTRGSSAGSPIFPEHSRSSSPFAQNFEVSGNVGNILNSALFADGRVPDDKSDYEYPNINLFSLGFKLFPRYNGPFNPFIDINTLMRQFAENFEKSSEASATDNQRANSSSIRNAYATENDHEANARVSYPENIVQAQKNIPGQAQNNSQYYSSASNSSAADELMGALLGRPVQNQNGMSVEQQRSVYGTSVLETPNSRLNMQNRSSNINPDLRSREMMEREMYLNQQRSMGMNGAPGLMQQSQISNPLRR